MTRAVCSLGLVSVTVQIYGRTRWTEGWLNMKRLILLLLVAVLAVPAIAGAQGTEEKRYQIPLENSPSIGPADALVTVFEFLDFQ